MRRSIRGKMILLIVGPILIIYLASLGLTLNRLRLSARLDIEQQMVHLAENYAARFDGTFRELAAIADATANFLETHPDLTEPQIFTQLRKNVLQNDAIYGAAMAFEPGTFKQDDSLFSPYVFRGPDGLEEMNIGRDAYDWHADEQSEWWHLPKNSGRGEWTAPYFDEGAGNVLMVTYSAPFFRDAQVRGVTTVDIMLTTLNESVGRGILSDLEFVILAQDGRYVYSPETARIMAKSVFDIAREFDRPEIAEAGRRLLSGEKGVTTLPSTRGDASQENLVFYAPIDSTGWGFAALLPEREAFAEVRSQMITAVIAMGATLLIIVLLILFVSGRITRPIGRLRSAVIQIADGKLDARAEGISSHDEIGDLARNFNTMAENLGAVVGQVRRSSITLHSTVTQLAATSREQESTAATFGTSSSQIAASVSEISSTGTELVRTMNQVSEVAIGTSELASSGQSSLQDMEETMRGLDESTRSIADKLGVINERATNITNVVTTISKVADQTNLLSVNAAIEAEKAGEYGVGFLVVAREIRRLADQTAAATLDIEHMVRDMQAAVSTGVMEMDSFAEHVRQSVREAAAISEQMGQIIERVGDNTTSFARINEGMHQQSEGANQINAAMRELSTSASRTKEATEEYVRAAADLQESIAAMKSSIATFDQRH